MRSRRARQRDTAVRARGAPNRRTTRKTHAPARAEAPIALGDGVTLSLSYTDPSGSAHLATLDPSFSGAALDTRRVSILDLMKNDAPQGDFYGGF